MTNPVNLRGTGPALIAGVLLLGLIFQQEIVAAIITWNDSTAYNHCFLIIPITAYLIWDRRALLTGLAAHPIPLVGLLALPLGAGWLVAERLGIMEGRQLVAVSLLELLFLGLLGWRLWRAIAGPLLYLYFLVPFGEFLTPKLQDITAIFVRYGLQLTNIPAYVDGYTIEIPEGRFFIAQACAGLRFLIASIAFGVLYALLMYRNPMRRTAFVAISIIVPIIANGFRAMGIVVLGHILGSAQAAAADHVIYGWIFFSVVILLLLVCGLPFREDHIPDIRPAPMPDVPGHYVLAGAIASIVIAILSIISPITALMLDRSATASLVAPRHLDFGSNCTTEDGAPPKRARAAVGGLAVDQRVTCGAAGSYDVHVAVFSPRNTSGPVMAERRRLGHPPWVEEVREEWVVQEPQMWRLLTGTGDPLAMVVGQWIEGQPNLGGMRTRARMAWHSLTGGQYVPVVVSITPVADWEHMKPAEQQRVETALVAFVREHADLGAQIQALTGR